jgi:hypothetical protein
VIYLVLSKIALPRIGAVLADRKSTITNDLAAAEELKQKAVAAEKAYNDALANARTEAAKIVAQAKAEIQKDLDAATAKPMPKSLPRRRSRRNPSPKSATVPLLRSPKWPRTRRRTGGGAWAARRCEAVHGGGHRTAERVRR